MIKTITLLRRNPELSPQEFEELYERDYATYAAKVIAPYALDYRRNYVQNMRGEEGIPQTKVEEDEFPYDCIVEITVRDQEALDGMIKAGAESFQRGEVPDISKLRSFYRSFNVIEHRTVFPESE